LSALLDTNAILYLLGGRVAEPLPAGQYYVSVISEIELLSYPLLDAAEEDRIRSFLSEAALIELTPSVRTAAIELRRQHKLKVPDAIIAASALTLGVELLTNDPHLLRIPALQCRSLRLK